VVSGFGVVKPACGADDGSEHCLSSASVVLHGIAVLGYVGGCCVSEKKNHHNKSTLYTIM
jgi:hypothetical protein